ncbi:MAG: phosphatidylinositol-specific phospholipase C domain-containing protein [Planctomycetota bacterium]|jgi:hypothetical protein|nr:phosphatidylinositol-specific phospholipase C domain-containing protein [Planctomycetota bacterium]MDP6763190.1 phosphatidylinositol-specific phospholipase C domain-containing protein [Planctomycetota bacterium]MDP6989558.1 phosphatidylinositol-specific phospholipase C domain-containing protein [Planctomycetota bacterium]
MLSIPISLALLSAVTAGEGDLQPVRTDWVAALHAEHPRTRLVDLVLPGTHDSGSHAITSDSPPAPGEPRLYSSFGALASAWARTQERSIAEQLSDGIRYLDLRVARHEGELVLVHGLVSRKLAGALEEIRSFAQAHPGEPVLLDFQAMPKAPAHPELDALLQDSLSAHLFEAAAPLDTWTLGALWESGRSLVAIFDHHGFAARRTAYVSRRVLDSVWTDSRTLEGLRERLDASIRSRAPDRLQCAYLTFTPRLETILSSPGRARSGLAGFTEPLRELPGRWLARWLDAGLRPNVISVDFYDRTDVVSAAIAANRRLLEGEEGR